MPILIAYTLETKDAVLQKFWKYQESSALYSFNNKYFETFLKLKHVKGDYLKQNVVELFMVLCIFLGHPY